MGFNNCGCGCGCGFGSDFGRDRMWCGDCGCHVSDCTCRCRNEIKVTSYISTPTDFRLVSSFQGELINCKHYVLKLVENLPVMTAIVPVLIQLTINGAPVLIPLQDFIGNAFFDDSLKCHSGCFRIQFGAFPAHFRCIDRIRRSAFFSQAECVGCISDIGSDDTILAPVETTTP